MDCSPPGSSVHGILQARILEWVAMPFSRGLSWPKDRTCISCLLHWPVGSLPLVSGKPPELVIAANFTYPTLLWPLGLSWPPVLGIMSQGVSYRNHFHALCTGFPFTLVIHRSVYFCSISLHHYQQKFLIVSARGCLFPLVPGPIQAI